MSASTLTELEKQIRLRYDTLSKRLQQVAMYLIDNKNDIALDTLNNTAQRACVPPSTLVRFASAFGFGGYNEMKILFRDNLMEETASYTDRARIYRKMQVSDEQPESPYNILQSFAMANGQAMQQLAARTPPQALQKAVELLGNAQCIYIVGLRRSFGIAVYLAYAFNHLEHRTCLVDGLGGMYAEQLSRIGDKDVLLCVSFSPYAEETLRISEAATKTGARQIVITDSQLSPLASISDVSFVVKEAQTEGFRSLVTTQCLAQTLVVSLAWQQSSNH